MTVLCLGEPLITLTPPPHTSLAVADEVHLGIGGAELNVAIHLARLGVPVSYAGAVGADPFGDRIRAALRGEGVDCAELRTGDGPTGMYAKEPGRTLYYRAGSAGSRLAPLAQQALAAAELVHVTGVVWGTRAPIVEAADALRTRPRTHRLSFDVNFRPALWSAAEAAPVLLAVARDADLVFVGRDEAETVWGTGDGEELRALLDATELVIKDEERDAEIWAEGRWWRSAPPATEIAEPVGAGDAFAAAYLSARRAGLNPQAAADRGHRLAAHVLASLSDQGVPGAEVYGMLQP